MHGLNVLSVSTMHVDWLVWAQNSLARYFMHQVTLIMHSVHAYVCIKLTTCLMLLVGDERPTLVAWFCIARLYYKMVKPDQHEAIDCMRKTLLYYNKVVEACEKHSMYCELMTAELPVCREMVKLLPMKISKMMARAE